MVNSVENAKSLFLHFSIFLSFQLVLPEYGLHAVCLLLFLIGGFWIVFLMNLPLLCYNIYRYFQHFPELGHHGFFEDIKIDYLYIYLYMNIFLIILLSLLPIISSFIFLISLFPLLTMVGQTASSPTPSTLLTLLYYLL